MKTVSETRERIIETATRLFHEQGYNLTGINQVIDEASVAKASLYQHFSSKEDLLIEYLTRFSEHWFQLLEDFIKSARTPKQRLLKIFDFRLKRTMDYQYAGCNFIKISSEVPRDHQKVFDLVSAHKERLRSFVYDLVKDIVGSAGKGVKRKADTVFLLMEGAAVSASLYKDGWPLKEAKIIVDGLL